VAGDDTAAGNTRRRTLDKNMARGLTRSARLIAFASAVLLIFAAALYFLWRDTTPSEEELREKAGLKGKPELLIGVQGGDIPGVSLQDPATGAFSGFDIDIGYLIAADLGFRPNEVRFVPIENEDRNRMLARDGNRYPTVDLVIATYSVTDERKRDPNVLFSSAYLNTEQSVMTLAGYPAVQDLGDLRDKPVCTITTSTSRTPVKEAGARVVGKRRISECIPGLRSGEFVAVTSDAAVLAGFIAAEPTVFRHHDIGLETPESWAVNVGPHEELRQLVNLALYRSQHDPEDKRWEDAYDRHLRPLEPASAPQPVAIDRQPHAEKVEVRQWPWERLTATIQATAGPRTRRRSRRADSSGPWRCCPPSR
jgi:glutamate transport system substrate-binding protein